MKTRIVDFLVDRLDPHTVYLFGSAAKGPVKPESDIDLAVLCDRRVDREALFRVQLDLAAILDRDIDLVDLRDADSILQMQVLANGEIIYCRDENKRLAAEAMMMKAYQMLNFNRRDQIIGKYGERVWKSL